MLLPILFAGQTSVWNSSKSPGKQQAGAMEKTQCTLEATPSGHAYTSAWSGNLSSLSSSNKNKTLTPQKSKTEKKPNPQTKTKIAFPSLSTFKILISFKRALTQPMPPDEIYLECVQKRELGDSVVH